MSIVRPATGTAAIPGAQRLAISSKPQTHRLGVILAALGIVLVALNLRTSVVSLSPIYAVIGRSFPISTTAQGILGTLPLVCFALFGVIAPRLTRRFGLETSLVISMAMVCAGEIARATLSESAVVFGLFSVLCLGGMGIANVLLPSAIKHHFPNSIGVMTSIYLALVTVSASVPAMLAVPLTNAFGWRYSIGLWSLLGLAAALPWLALIQRHDSDAHPKAAATVSAWRWPTTWAIMVLFSVGALTMYALIAWLPTLLTNSAGVSAVTAGLMLSIYNLIGFPHSLLVPVLMTRLKRPYVVIAFATLCLSGGTLGLGHAPQWSWFWIFPAGLGAMFVPIGLTLVNMRSRTEDGTTALSSFVQSAGYLMAAIGPVLVGALHSMTGGWTVPCWFMALAGVVAGIAGVFAVRPVFIEDAARR